MAFVIRRLIIPIITTVRGTDKHCHISSKTGTVFWGGLKSTQWQQKHFINHKPQGGLMPPHANKNVHKLWNEGRVLFICDTSVCITHTTNRAVMARDDPLLWRSPGDAICQRCPRFYKTRPTIRSTNTCGYTAHNGRARLRRGQLKCGGTRAETRFRLSAKRTSPFKSARGGGRQFSRLLASRGVRISGSNAGYTMFRGSVNGTGYPLHSPVSPSLALACVTLCHHISTGV